MPYRFSTANVTPDHRGDAWREVSSTQFVPLDPAPLGEAREFGARLFADTFADCGWALISTTKHVVNRTESTIKQSSPGTMFVNLQLEGSGTLTHHGSCKHVRPGDVAVIDTDAPFSLHYPEDMKMACFSVPKERFATPTSGGIVSRDARQGSVLATFLRGLAFGGIRNSAYPETLADQLSTLLRSCAGAPAQSRSAHTIARLRAVIEENLGNPRLSATELASMVFLSRSRLYEVLASEQLTIRGLLTEARLDRAEQHLTDPEYGHHSIGLIAQRVGFTDCGTFTRAFKRRHGVTPGCWRNQSGT